MMENAFCFIHLKGARKGLTQFLRTESPLKNDEKCLLFHLGSSFRLQDI